MRRQRRILAETMGSKPVSEASRETRRPSLREEHVPRINDFAFGPAGTCRESPIFRHNRKGRLTGVVVYAAKQMSSTTCKQIQVPCQHLIIVGQEPDTT